MERMLAHLSDRIIAVSEQVKQDLVRYGVAPPEKITVIPLGLELDPFLEGDVHRGALRRELGVPTDAPVVGIVGRIFPIKNHRLFLEAAALVAAKEPGARFVVVGDGTLRADMEALARHLDIGERTIFTGWRRDLPKVYADLDVLVVSSDNEGTPVSAIEAMASGCPVVATRVGGLPDLIEDGEVGHLVAARDAEAMAAAILGLLGDGDRARRMGRSARRRVQDRYRVERLCGDIEALYTELLVPRKDSRVTGSPRPLDLALKRLFDVALATAGLVGSAPLWGLAALAIKLEDGGPVFFRQERWGQHGRRMPVLKFRTMITNANPAGVTVQATKEDPRITRVGRVLRATAFDGRESACEWRAVRCPVDAGRRVGCEAIRPACRAESRCRRLCGHDLEQLRPRHRARGFACAVQTERLAHEQRAPGNAPQFCVRWRHSHSACGWHGNISH